MKKKLAKILGVGLTLVMVSSLAIGFAVPVSATVSITATPTVEPNAISTAAKYTIKFDAYFPLDAASSATVAAKGTSARSAADVIAFVAGDNIVEH